MTPPCPVAVIRRVVNDKNCFGVEDSEVFLTYAFRQCYCRQGGEVYRVPFAVTTRIKARAEIVFGATHVPVYLVAYLPRQHR